MCLFGNSRKLQSGTYRLWQNHRQARTGKMERPSWEGCSKKQVHWRKPGVAYVVALHWLSCESFIGWAAARGGSFFLLLGSRVAKLVWCPLFLCVWDLRGVVGVRVSPAGLLRPWPWGFPLLIFRGLSSETILQIPTCRWPLPAPACPGFSVPSVTPCWPSGGTFTIHALPITVLLQTAPLFIVLFPVFPLPKLPDSSMPQLSGLLLPLPLTKSASCVFRSYNRTFTLWLQISVYLFL